MQLCQDFDSCITSCFHLQATIMISAFFLESQMQLSTTENVFSNFLLQMFSSMFHRLIPVYLFYHISEFVTYFSKYAGKFWIGLFCMISNGILPEQFWEE